QSAAALADDLERWLRGEPVVARPVGPLALIGKWARRHPLKAALPVMVLLGVIAFLAVDYFRSNPFQDASSIAPPKILSVEPREAAAGAPVTLTGADFSPKPSANLVFFPGGIRAVVKEANPSRLSVIAPAGTKYGSITVTASRRTAYSPKPYTPTFAGSTDFGPQSFEPKIHLPVPV